MTSIKLVSEEDSSINYVVPSSDGGYFESRFVQRSNDYFIIYLSSHSGCNQACRFCHLTQTKQTNMVQATFDDYLLQVQTALDHWTKNKAILVNPEKIHVNFMARGEPLLNETVVNNWDDLSANISNLIVSATGNHNVHFKISTIFKVK